MRKTLFPFLPLMALLIFTLTACSSQPPALTGSSWRLVSYGPAEAQIPAVEGIDTHLDFGNDGNVGGSLGCNSFGGSFTVKKDSITFGPLAATEMACPEAQMAQEGSAFQVLNGTVKFERGDGTLTIFSSDGKTKLVLEGLMKAN